VEVTSMAPAAVKASSADEPWLSLRRRHDAELRDFQQQVQEQKTKFLENVQRARAKLLAQHAEQEGDFWSKARGSANLGANNVTASKTGVQSQANEHFTDPNPTTLGLAQTPKPVPPKPISTTPAPRPAHRSAAVTYIDLCSDDDEPIVVQKKPDTKIATTPTLNVSTLLSNTHASAVVTNEAPIYPIPSASLELFGNTSKASHVS
jgi:hypothetical protein